jgi:predicted nucleic acid-binding protein
MTLCDAGPLFALIDPRQEGPHRRCREALASIRLPLLTSWPCFTEAMYLAHRAGGWRRQELPWRFVTDGVVKIHSSSEDEVDRMKNLMSRYRDLPMDLADASLVALAESEALSVIFSLDHHFRVYRMDDGRSFTVIPG